MSNGLIVFDKVTRSYGAGDIVALREVDLTIRKGERVAVRGHSGSGKSTLLNVMCGLDVPTSGKVLFEGEDLSSIDDDQRTRLRRQRIGMIFQTFNLLPTLSGTENVSLPLRLGGRREKDANSAARAMLDRVGLSSRVDHRPDEMSGGERQRVAIARALIFDPPVLLADEPTGNLDSVSGHEILRLLGEVHREFGTTIVLVTHNDEAAHHCERQIRLSDGRIAEDITQVGDQA